MEVMISFKMKSKENNEEKLNGNLYKYNNKYDKYNNYSLFSFRPVE